MENRGNVEFETIKSEEVKFGKNNFLEIARKKAVTGEGSNEFIAISRGFFLPDGTKRFRRSLALPDDGSIIEFVVKKLQEFHVDSPKEEAPAETSEPVEAETPAESE